MRDQAQLKNAKVDLERYRVLTSQDSIAEQQYATQKSLVQQLEGTIKFDQGQIDTAKLQLHYSRITAPEGGRVGLRPDRPGQYCACHRCQWTSGDHAVGAYHRNLYHSRG